MRRCLECGVGVYGLGMSAGSLFGVYGLGMSAEVSECGVGVYGLGSAGVVLVCMGWG